MDVKKRLLELAEPEYREFHGKLLPGVDDILGVRVPALRKLAKEIISSDWRAFLEENAGETYEERQLLGLVTAGAWKKMDLEELLARKEEKRPVEEEFHDPMLVFCGMTHEKLDHLLTTMERAGLPRIALKAVLTPTNGTWTSQQLWTELRREHEAMQTQRKKEK